MMATSLFSVVSSLASHLLWLTPNPKNPGICLESNIQYFRTPRSLLPRACIIGKERVPAIGHIQYTVIVFYFFQSPKLECRRSVRENLHMNYLLYNYP